MRKINCNASVFLIETEICNKVPLFLFVMIAAIFTVGLSFLFLIVPKRFKYEEVSTWNCSVHVKSFDYDLCSGVDILHPDPDNQDSQYFLSNSRRDDVKYDLLLLGRPVSKHQSVGISFDLMIQINDTVEHLDDILSQTRIYPFVCDSHKNCSEVLLLNFDGKQHNFTVELVYRLQDSRATEWLGDFIIIWRSYNISSEWTYMAIAYSYLFITLTILICYITVKIRQTLKPSFEYWWTLLLLIFTSMLDSPFEFMYAFYWGPLMKIVDDVLHGLSISFCGLYVLIILGGLLPSSRRNSSSVVRFFLPRTLLSIIIALFYISFIIHIDFISIIDIDGSKNKNNNNNNNISPIKTLQIILFCVLSLWLLWFWYSITRIVIFIKNKPNKFSGRYKVLVGVIVMYEVIIQLIVCVTIVKPTLDDSNVLDYVLLSVGNLFAWMMGIFFFISKKERVVFDTFKQPKKVKSKLKLIIN